jgi:hypothetical protein
MKNLKDSRDQYSHTVKRKDIIIAEQLEKINYLDEQKLHLEIQLLETSTTLTESQANFKMAAVEIVGLRKRIEKMKQMSLKMYHKKICKNCLKEYDDDANYNWSCRTHQSEYGGVIWWCCGRKNKDDLGCKYSKHETREEHDNSR